MSKRALAPLLLFAIACTTQPAPTPAPVAAPTVAVAMNTTPAAAVAAAPAAPPCDTGMPLMNASLWMQSAAEYRAAAQQTYNVARRMLDAALADKTWSAEPTDPDNDGGQPTAIILDLDETAWSNMPFEARMIRQGKTYEAKEWKQWVSESAATAVPGAADFLAYAHSRGVTPFYVSNRDLDEKPAGRRNLEKLGYPLKSEEDTLLLRGERPEWTSDKTSRRTFIASRYRVLLLLGDDLNDFTNAREKTPAERDAIINDTLGLWGTKWLIVPNPIYGSWERQFTADAKTGCDQLKQKLEGLQEKRP